MNTQTKQALEMAIEALEHASERSIIIDAYEEIINACKEALNIANCDLKQTEQEPVAWMYENDVTKAYFETKESSLVLEYGCKETPLYTHPKQWQGLTDDEVDDFMFQSCDAENGYSITDLIRLVEQSLKDKNT
jgi:hypothetical protein